MGKRTAYKDMTYEDLLKIYYGPNLNGKNVSANEIKQYEDALRTKLVTKWRERDVAQFFSYLGEVEPVRRSNQEKTSDFKIVAEKLIIEVTSINTAPAGEQDEYGRIPLNLPRSEDEFIEKINEKIEHAEEKEDTLGYNKKIAVIHYDPILVGLRPDFMEKLFDLDFIRKTGFLSSSLDGLIFLPPKVAILGDDSDIKIPGPVCYVKEQKMVDLLSRISGLEVKLLSLLLVSRITGDKENHGRIKSPERVKVIEGE
jgi:hypothetical protein